jgi:hypothetical protein
VNCTGGRGGVRVRGTGGGRTADTGGGWSRNLGAYRTVGPVLSDPGGRRRGRRREQHRRAAVRHGRAVHLAPRLSAVHSCTQL